MTDDEQLDPHYLFRKVELRGILPESSEKISNNRIHQPGCHVDVLLGIPRTSRKIYTWFSNGINTQLITSLFCWIFP